MNRLQRAVQEYLALRRSLGFELRHETWLLPDFVAYLKRHRSAVITTDLAVQWARQPAEATPGWWRHRLTAVRQFARYYRGFEPRTEIPAAEFLPRSPRRQTPHIYSDQEIATLMQQAKALRHPLQAATYTALIGLLAATGLRVGEAIALHDDDIDWAGSLLIVRYSKGKSRQVPLHESTLLALQQYATTRDRLLNRRDGSFFVSIAGTRIHQQNLGRVFIRLRQHLDLRRPLRRPPHIHDLRHTFTVNTLLDWYRKGVDVEQRLPWLSTYLGHVSPSATYWYLTAIPELLALANQRARRAWRATP